MIKNLLNSDEEAALNVASETEYANAPLSLFDRSPEPSENALMLDPVAETAIVEETWDPEPVAAEPAIVIEPFVPPSKVETIRRSGLAWSAGVVFFGSVGFMMILGWFADLLLGSAPYGLVVGIVLGSVIGFINFFRITSQIFKNN